ncbi:MAG: hypothetical protein FJ403_00350 [Verrucomicrobia bacterium]|nr:hypothetical protein [Verrucomicrobiota bacterium]
MNSCNFIVIGGGASGCALASALSKKGKTLLLERGKRTEEEPLTQTGAGWPAVRGGSATNRQQTKAGSWVLTGSVRGGGTSINAGVFLKEPDGHFFKDPPGRMPRLCGRQDARRYDVPATSGCTGPHADASRHHSVEAQSFAVILNFQSAAVSHDPT